MVWTLVIVFALNVLSSTLGTLKTIFISKKIKKPAYIVTFIDSIVFAYGLKMIADGEGFWIIISFSLGKLVGTYLADILDDKMAFGLMEASIYANKEKATEMADFLRDMGFSVTTVKGYGVNGRDRFLVNIALKRKEFPLIKDFLKENGYNNSNMIMRELSSYSGKSIREVGT